MDYYSVTDVAAPAGNGRINSRKKNCRHYYEDRYSEFHYYICNASFETYKSDQKIAEKEKRYREDNERDKNDGSQKRFGSVNDYSRISRRTIHCLDSGSYSRNPF